MRIFFTAILITLFAPKIYGREGDSLVIFFWNVENLFYPEDDSITLDDEFTPGGERYWTFSRYYSKLTRIWKTIIAAGNPYPPDIIAFAEIENAKVVRDIIYFSPAGKYNYKIIHRDSPDRRGIDVGLLYNPAKVSLFLEEFIAVELGGEGGSETREILHAGFTWNDDSIHVFINHWPSKYGGAGYSDPFRMNAAKILSDNVNLLKSMSPGAKIICAGDFNDGVESESLKYLLNNARLSIVAVNETFPGGSLKFQGRWETIDHYFVSDNLMNKNYQLSVQFFAPEFLFEKDEIYGGLKPHRTWEGFKFREGFSDHLPVLLKVAEK